MWFNLRTCNVDCIQRVIRRNASAFYFRALSFEMKLNRIKSSKNTREKRWNPIKIRWRRPALVTLTRAQFKSGAADFSRLFSGVLFDFISCVFFIPFSTFFPLHVNVAGTTHVVVVWTRGNFSFSTREFEICTRHVGIIRVCTFVWGDFFIDVLLLHGDFGTLNIQIRILNLTAFIIHWFFVKFNT